MSVHEGHDPQLGSYNEVSDDFATRDDRTSDEEAKELLHDDGSSCIGLENNCPLCRLAQADAEESMATPLRIIEVSEPPTKEVVTITLSSPISKDSQPTEDEIQELKDLFKLLSPEGAIVEVSYQRK